MLQIEDLQVKLGDKEILKHIDLEILPGETHILFGPNWSGKTSLLMTIMGYPQYRVTGGKILFICCRALEVQGVRLRTLRLASAAPCERLQFGGAVKRTL